MPKRPALLTPPARLPKVSFVTEAQLAHLLRVTPETLRSWRRRGEMPPIAVGPEVDEFVAGLRRRGPKAICYAISDVSAWLFGNGGKGGRPKELPASAFDPALDRTGQIRMAAEATPNLKEKDRLRRQLTGQAKFVARLGFASVSDYEDWLKRGAPEDELPPECRAEPDAAGEDDPSIERLSQRTDTAIAKMRGVSPRVVTAERRRAEPPPPPQPPHDSAKATSSSRVSSPWASLDDDPFFDPFATGRSPRRGPGGYFSGWSARTSLQPSSRRA